MTTRNLDALFAPRSVALIGANRRPGSVGETLGRSLLDGGFKGHVHLVDAHATEPDDRAVVATPAETVPKALGADTPRPAMARA